MTEKGKPSSPKSKNLTGTRRGALGLGVAAAAAALLGDAGAAEQTGGKLVLRQPDLAARTDDFFKDLRADPKLQKTFIENPSGVMTQRFLPPGMAQQIPPQRLSNANRVLYSVVANAEFRKWAETYQPKFGKDGEPDKGQMAKDLSAAVIRFGDAPLVQGLIEDTTFGRPEALADWVVAVDAVVVAWAFAIVAFAAVVVAFAKPSGTFTAAEFRALTEQMVGKAMEMKASGALEQSYIR